MHGEMYYTPVMYTPVPVYRDKAVMQPLAAFIVSAVFGLALGMVANHFLNVNFMTFFVGIAMSPLLRDLACTTVSEFRANKRSTKAINEARDRRIAASVGI